MRYRRVAALRGSTQMPNIQAPALLFLLTGLLACKRSPGAAAEAPTAAPGLPAGPSFRKDVLPMLATTCAATDGCHGADATDRVNIDLREPAAYRTLVRRPAELRPGALLVDPGNPAKSFLLDKLTRRLAEGEGKAMPLDPKTGRPMDPSPLGGFLERALIPWIEQGAQDN
jgi:hypothetical protein